MATSISTSSSTSGPLAAMGVGSGLDITAIVSKLMAVEQQPLVTLNTKEASYQAKLSAYGTLTSSVSSLQSSVDALKASTLYTKFAATSSDSTIFSATANSAASKASRSINVVTLASAQTLTSQVFSSLSSATSTINGQLKIELGTYDSASSTFTATSSRSPTTISIAAADSSLSTIRDQINAANAGVTAKIVSVDSAGTQFKLSITSNTSGVAGSLRITAMDASGNALTNNTNIAKFSYDPTKASGSGNEYTVSAAAQDAHLQVDGVDLYRNTNTIGDAITGVSMTLAKTGSATLNVAPDTTAIQSAIESFVKDYNSTVSLGRQMSLYDSKQKTAGILTGDSAARNLLSQLSNMTHLEGPGASSTINSLSDLGIALKKDGSLVLNTIKLQSALSGSLDDVATLLTSTDSTLPKKGLAVQMSSQLGTILSSKGLLSSSTTGLQSRINLLEKRKAALQQRLTQVQANYQKQFNSLDTLLASMQSTQSYLTTQLASISKNTSSG
ncbi:MAG TPA: flagellar filament capping protein FliD [Rhodocyclaceae bacterium]|nr:flagellar filament capping protein FliD [Rhodocyclaceae bacterium]